MKKIKTTLVLLAVYCCYELLPMSSTKPRLGLSVKNLKGTHEVLKDYPGYEPFWGLVFVEKDVARNLYAFSTHQIKKEASEIIKKADSKFNFLKEQVEDFLQGKENTAIQNLVRHMFHQVGGTFNITNAANNPVKQFTPEHLGKVLRIVHDSGTDYVKMETDLKKCLLSLGLLDPKGKPFPGKDFNPFVKNLVGAVQECSAQNPNALFAPGTAQGIILGYLLLKANDRVDLEQYFTGFLGTDVTLPQEQYSEENFKDILSATSDVQDSKQFAEFVCAMIYQQKYASFFPKLSTSKMVSYAGISFTDCVESMMLNMINIATYNQEKARLGFVPKELRMNNALVEFYKQHADASKIDHANVNQAWTDIVENIEGVVYNRIVDSASSEQLQVGDFCDGAIPVEQVYASLPVKIVQVGQKDFRVYEKLVGSQTYWLVPKQSGLVCCELMPTASNIIVLMNNLFHLRLYSNVEDVFNPDFVKAHFVPMCQKFNWTVETKDFQEFMIQVVGVKSFMIHLSSRSHGCISIDQAASTETHRVKLLNLSLRKQAVCVALGLERIKADFLLTLFYKQLLNPDDRLEIIKTSIRLHDKRIKQFLDNLIVSFSFQADDYYRDCLIDRYLVRPYKSIEIILDLDSLKLNDISQEHFRFYRKYFCNDAHKDQLLLLINTVNKNGINNQALYLVDAAVEKGVLNKADVEKVLSLIEIGLSKDYSVQKVSLSLAKTVVEKKLFDRSHAEKIFSWIEIGLNNKDNFVQRMSLWLAGDAVENNLFDAAQVKQILLMAKDPSFKGYKKFNDYLKRFEQKATDKGLLSKQLKNEDFLTSGEQESGMMALATKKGVLSKVQMDRVRAGLSADVQLLQQQPERFVPPSADQLEQQREAIEEFNRNAQQQELQPPFDLQLPKQQAAGQIATQPAGMVTGLQAKVKDALRRGLRYI